MVFGELEIFLINVVVLWSIGHYRRWSRGGSGEVIESDSERLAIAVPCRSICRQRRITRSVAHFIGPSFRVSSTRLNVDAFFVVRVPRNQRRAHSHPEFAVPVGARASPRPTNRTSQRCRRVFAGAAEAFARPAAEEESARLAHEVLVHEAVHHRVRDGRAHRHQMAHSEEQREERDPRV